MNGRQRWEKNQQATGWQMPPATWWKRLPIIRHLRAMWALYQVERHYSVGMGQFGIRTGFDEWVVYGIAIGRQPSPRRYYEEMVRSFNAEIREAQEILTCDPFCAPDGIVDVAKAFRGELVSLRRNVSALEKRMEEERRRFNRVVGRMAQLTGGVEQSEQDISHLLDVFHSTMDGSATTTRSFDQNFDVALRAALAAYDAAQERITAARTSKVSDAQIRHMVESFLRWRLPDNFNPDGGISFARTYNGVSGARLKHEPVGTNLLDATQAEAMVRHMLIGLPGATVTLGAEQQSLEVAEAMRLAGLVIDAVINGRLPSAEWAREIRDRISSFALLKWRPTHRHKKRGSEYQLLGIGKMQAEDWHTTVLGTDDGGQNAWEKEPVDMREVAIYRGEGGDLWARPREEFNDGRFEALPTTPDSQGGEDAL